MVGQGSQPGPERAVIAFRLAPLAHETSSDRKIGCPDRGHAAPVDTG
jgi:hypothetical protein